MRISACHLSANDNMQIFKFSLSILLLAVSALADAKVEPPTELKIDVTHLPSDCPAKARTGDSIQVHYVSGTH
jgi:hypothetical protein